MARSATRKRVISTASNTPATRPMPNPASTNRSENHTPSSTRPATVCSDARFTGSDAREMMSLRCGMMLSFDRGRILKPSTSPPFSGPSHL
jgi:hypothetical protein